MGTRTHQNLVLLGDLADPVLVEGVGLFRVRPRPEETRERSPGWRAILRYSCKPREAQSSGLDARTELAWLCKVPSCLRQPGPWSGSGTPSSSWSIGTSATSEQSPEPALRPSHWKGERGGEALG